MSDVAPWVWAALAGLLFLSGFFSSSETALFSLTPGQRAVSTPLVRRLLGMPRRLLVSILFGNLVTNVLYFAFAGRLLPGDGGVGDLGVGLGVLVAILVFGEIVPKTIGLRSRVAVARVTTPALHLVVVVLGRLANPLVRLLERCHRVVSLWVHEERIFSADVLAHLMERGAEEGSLAGKEADLAVQVVELGQIRVREIMTPRVDALFLDLSGADRGAVTSRAVEVRQSWLPVVDATPDRIVGRVRVRDLLRFPDRPIRQLVMPVKFVPEVADVLDLLRTLYEDRATDAVVVDEWGGTAGFVTVEDVFEEIVGDLRAEGEQRVPAVVPLGEGRYRVSGSLSIRDWNEEFGLSVVPTEFETVGGFVTALLGRIPRAGDVTRFGNLVMEVHEVRGRRVYTLDIGLETPAGARPEAVR